MPKNVNPKTVVVGYGYAGRAFHAYLIGLAEGLDLYGIASRREEVRREVETELGLKAFAGLDEVLEDPNVDLVVIATPNDTHAPYAIQAMDAGKHVVVDKPMSLTVSEADAMIDAARRNRVLLSLFHNRRLDGDFLTVQQTLEDGRLGELLFAEVAWHQCKPPRTWRSKRSHGGGKFLDLASHMIDQALLLVPGRVLSVSARFQYGMWEMEVEDHSHCVLSFESGVDFHVDVSSLSRCPKPRWYLLGTEGTLRKDGLDPQEKAMNAGDIDAAREDPSAYARLWTGKEAPFQQEILKTIPGHWRSFYENIADAIRGDAAPLVTTESVRRTMLMLEAAQQSAESGVPVDPQDV